MPKQRWLTAAQTLAFRETRMWAGRSTIQINDHRATNSSQTTDKLVALFPWDDGFLHRIREWPAAGPATAATRAIETAIRTDHSRSRAAYCHARTTDRTAERGDGKGKGGNCLSDTTRCRTSGTKSPLRRVRPGWSEVPRTAATSADL